MTLRASRVQALAIVCLLVGFAGEALFHRAQLGLNFTLFVLLAASVHASFTKAPAVRWRRVAAAAVPALASVPVFLFDSQWSRFFAIPLACAWLVLVPRFVERGFTLDLFGSIPERAADALVRIVPALGRIVKLPTLAFAGTSTERSSSTKTVLLGLLLGIPSALVFIVLFSFDPKFSRAIVAVGRRSDDALAFTLSAVALSLLLLLLVTVEELRKSSLSSDDARAAGRPDREPYRAVPQGDEPTLAEAKPTSRFSIPPMAWALVLLQVSAVFLLYVVLHATELFAGHAYVRTTRGVTYASQLHAGFFSLLVATGLSVSFVLVGHAIYAKKRETWTTATATSVAASEVLLAALTLPTLASCGQKLLLYVDAYGQTYLRLAVALAVLTAFPLVLLTMFKSLRPAWGGFGAATALLALVSTSGAAFFDADAHVAKVNVERALRGKPLHYEYLASLGDRKWLGVAAARPADPTARAAWEKLIQYMEDERIPAMADLRGYRRSVRCSRALADVAHLCSR